MQDGYTPLEIVADAGADRAWCELRVGGEVDIATAADLRDAIIEQIGSGRHVVVDIGRVTFMDGSGVAALLAAHTEAGRTGVKVCVTGARARSVKLALQLTRADTVLSIE
jgi:anti-anti-sigma factor